MPRATINVDADEVAHMLADELAGRLTITDQVITVTNAISVDNANLLDATTTGVVTASITTTETVDELKTLTGTGNAYTIVIAAGDAGSTADEFNTINGKTTVAVDASNVTGLASDTLSNISTLLTAGNDTNQFTANSFSGLTAVTVSDTTIDVSDFVGAVDQANAATGNTSTVFTIAAGATINGGNEANFSALLTDETNNQVTITDQNLTVNTGTISVDNANLLGATTTGVVTATIATTETVTELATLSADGGTNALTVVIRADDATGATAAQLNTINDATSVAVDLTNVTALAASSLSDLELLQLPLVIMNLIMTQV